MSGNSIIYGATALLLAALIAFTTTPIVRVLSYKLGAIDVPKDDRRMHKNSIPLLGGLSIFTAFVISSLIFGQFSPTIYAIYFGGLIIVATGVLDDIFSLHPMLKLFLQFVAAVAVISFDIKIEYINLFGQYHIFDFWAYPITVLWIVGLINAINLIDGLDGLACGVSAIAGTSLLIVSYLMSDPQIALITAILVGSCIGFLPFNSFPAKIFMGDTGAMFLGLTLSVLSIEGVFKMNTVFSFLAPLAIFGFPLFDTILAFIRRIIHGKNPFKGDREHIHHKLIAMGFNQKQSVLILYAICGILGISSIVLTYGGFIKALFVLGVGLIILMANYMIVKHNTLKNEIEKMEKKTDK